MEEGIWIGQLQNGDAKAFERLVATFQSRVYNTCLNFVFDQQDAEDLTQEVFVEVFRSIGGFQARSSLGTWIYRISVTKSLEFLRSRNRKKRSGTLMSLFGLQQTGWDARAPEIDHPGFALENKERAQKLFSALHALPENQRIAFTLHNLDARSYDEVAQVMGVSLGSVESLIFRARKNLQKTLENFYRSDD